MKKIVKGYDRKPYSVKGKIIRPKHTGTYPRTVRNQKHVLDHVEHGEYSRRKDTYGRYYGDIDYKAEEYKE